MQGKQRAAEEALGLIADGNVVGLGTGSTADYFLQALAEALKTGKLRDVRGVPTSRPCERRARHLGIPLTTLPEASPLDVTVDGADEIDPKLNLIKGLGGALLREKIVAQNSRRFVVIADGSKRVSQLGTRAPLPVEVVPFGHETHMRFFRQLGAEPALRRTAEGGLFATDNDNVIYDCRFPKIDDPAALARALRERAGIVENGLFLNIAEVALIGYEDHVERIERDETADERG